MQSFPARGLRAAATLLALLAGVGLMSLVSASVPPSPSAAIVPGGAFSPAVRRVLQLGDSHTGSDSLRRLLRADLQARFGDGGAGLTFPWPAGSRTRGEAGASAGWKLVSLPPSRLAATPIVGLRGLALEASRPGEKAWLEATFSDLRVHLLAQPGGGRAVLKVDGREVAEVNTGAARTAATTVGWSQAGPAAPHRVELQSAGAGPVRILGVATEAAGGATYSPQWVNGAQAAWLLRLPEPVLAGLVRGEAPEAIVVAFGTNEACEPALDAAAYEASLGRLLDALRAAAPAARLVLVAPPDGGGRVDERALAAVEGAQRRLAVSRGAAFLDLREVMGGPGSMAHWMSSELARRDAVHFTEEGYRRLASSVSETLVAALGAAPPAVAARSPVRAAARARLPPAASSSGIYLFRRQDGVYVMTDDPSKVAGQPGEWVTPGRR